VTSTTSNSVSSRSGVASTRTSLTEQFDSGVFDYARVSVQTTATNSDKIYRSYNDLNVGVIFLEHSVFNGVRV